MEPAYVRDTSLHLQEMCPPMPELRRASTGPAKLRLFGEQDFSGGCSAAVGGAPTPPPDGPPPPPPEDLNRLPSWPLNASHSYFAEQPGYDSFAAREAGLMECWGAWPPEHVEPVGPLAALSPLEACGGDSLPGLPLHFSPLLGLEGYAPLWQPSPSPLAEEPLGLRPTAGPLAPDEAPLLRARSGGSCSSRGTSSSREAGRQEALGAPPPQPQTLVRSVSEESGVFRVCWTVDAKKLKSSNKVTVSPSFEHPEVSGSFKIMLYPKAISDRRGGASFKKAKGKGSVQLKCEAALGKTAGGALSLRVAIGNGRGGRDAALEPARGPVRHDFSESGVCGLPKHQEEWNFARVVDEASQTFAVVLEFLPQDCA